MTHSRVRWLSALFLSIAGVVAPAARAGQATSPNVTCTGTGCVPLTINLVDSTGAPVTIPEGYRWLIQVDKTYNQVPGAPAVPHTTQPGDNGFTPHAGETLSVSFHASYSPPIASGDTTGPPPAAATPIPSLDPSQRYFVSVMPYGTSYNMGGAPVVFTGGTAVATVAVSPLPVPTGQISVLAFEDKYPLNNENELPEERGLPGFNVQVLDTGGTLGITGGLLSNDAFGHKLGTTYQIDAQGNPVMTCGGPCVIQEGTGLITTDANGAALVKYLPPGKWGVLFIPPAMPAGQEWHQTSTLEGQHDIEAFVKAKEPAVFVEFGPPGYHVAVGFIQKFDDLGKQPAPSGRVTLTGRIRNNHWSRPPDFHFFAGEAVPHAWVALNDLSSGAAGTALYAAPCDPVTGAFSIPNVPVGSTYQLVAWDDPNDSIFEFWDASVPATASGSYDLGNLQQFSWFGKVVWDFYYDTNGNGVRDPGEPGIPGQNVNIRWRDGSIFDSKLTDDSGRVTFREVFPFFNWLVNEPDFSRWGTTGLTVRVDAGGAIDPTDPDTMGGELNPQLQTQITPGGPEWNTATNNNKSRVERISPVDGSLIATEAMQIFNSEAVHYEYAKHVWGDNNPATAGVMLGMPNGGIAGGVWYDTTRAEDDPRLAVAETWQPGVPRVQMNLYTEDTRATWDPALVPPGPNPLYHGKIQHDPTRRALPIAGVDCTSPLHQEAGCSFEPADVDNWPFGWSTGGAMGPEDVKRNGDSQAAIDACNANRNCAFDPGDTYVGTIPGTTNTMNLIGASSSWDDTQPTGCVGPVFSVHGQPTDCYDGLRNFNQSRPGTIDGFYGFGGVNGPGAPQLPAGNYIVEAVAPPGYRHTSEEAKNINFGQSYSPSPNNLLAECVGDLHVVAPQLELFPGVPTVPLVNGKTRPYCDRKLIPVYDGQNAAADFFLYTLVPVASNMVGVTTDDLTNEFDPNAPTFGEKYAPPHMPISIQDWTGKELYRTYTDEFGAYNGLVPSSFSANIPVPSGFDPNMLTVCMNHPGPIPDPAHPGQTMIDPYFLRQYSQFCYNWSFMPGKASYLDTPVVPVAAFTGPQQSVLDCEVPDGTPKIYSVTGPRNSGPWVSAGWTAANGNLLTIISQGAAAPVPNPMYDETNPAAFPRTVNRDYGFGPFVAGSSQVTFRDTNASYSSPSAVAQAVTLMCGGAVQTNCIQTWTPDMIVLRTPSFPTAGQGTALQLQVTRSSGVSSVTGVTVTVGGKAPTMVAAGQSIQKAIDAAAAGDLITVAPGRYTELLRMWKPVRLQGWGEGSVTLDATAAPNDRIQAWQQAMDAFMTAHPSYLLPGQPTGAGLPEPTLFATEQGPAIIVVAPSGAFNATTNPNVYRRVGGIPNGRIDGFRITGGSTAGAIFINGYAHQFQVTNNRIVGNQGFYGGGIRAGYPSLVQTVNGVDQYVSGQNDNLSIAYNQITENAGLAGAGGGISLCTGSTSYQVTRNWICGNYSNGSGGGIGHLGLSNNGQIDHNKILFNQTFDQSTNPAGGGIYVGGEAPIAAAVGGTTITPGAGNVTINANLIQGNLAGAGEGGGIRAELVNGADIVARPKPPNPNAQWYDLKIYNNIVVNNMAGLAGGALSLQDVVLPDIINNTFADDDSTATAGSAFPAGSPNQSAPLYGGIVSHAHTTALVNAFAASTAALRSEVGIFSNPGPVVPAGEDVLTRFANNTIWGSRSFYAFADPNATNLPAPFLLTLASTGITSDLQVLGTGPTACGGGPCVLRPTNSALSSLVAPYAGNGNVAGGSAAALFPASYTNGQRSALSPFANLPGVQFGPAFDEGGNYIDVRFFPLTLNDPTNGGALFGNYTILANSPTRNTGSNAAANSAPELNRDFFENRRPATAANPSDIGAVEYPPAP